MIYTELPAAHSNTNRTYNKKHVSVITPDRLLLNEKRMLTVMLAGVAAVLVTWAFRKGK